jgi:hypothetical protein
MSRKEGPERNNTDRKPLLIVSMRPMYKQRRYEYVDNKKKERKKERKEIEDRSQVEVLDCIMTDRLFLLFHFSVFV